ncbi:hypothetical protein PV325_004337, partial [Microctonus aethiopoides]
LFGIISLITECLQSYRLTINLLLHFIGIAVLILAIDGTVNEDVRLIFPLVSSYFVSLFMLLPIILFQIIGQAIKESASDWAYVVISLTTIIGFVIGLFFFKLIHSFYQELLRKKFSPSNDSTTAKV